MRSKQEQRAGRLTVTRRKVSPVIHCVQKFGNIRETLLDLDKRYEVVVDTAGRDSKEMRTGITAANVVLVPIQTISTRFEHAGALCWKCLKSFGPDA
uniref:hypothetical protein n=1 Tax=Salmonella sp. TaxID=599 RepID=UPI0029815724|nr:hypothetical protein [Salmonella sp.]